MGDNEVYFSVNEFSQLVGLSRQTVYKRMRQDLSPFVKVVDKRKMLSEQALRLFETDKVVNQTVNQGLLS